SLGITNGIDNILANLDKNRVKKYDVGRIEGLKEPMLFLESFGYGIFPELMKRIKENERRKEEDPEKEMKAAQELLQTIILNYPAEMFNIIIDGTGYAGNYILAEVMNISSIGPNLN